MESKDLGLDAPLGLELALVVAWANKWLVKELARKPEDWYETASILYPHTTASPCPSSLFPNDILTPFLTHPDLMDLPRRDIDPRSNTKRLLGRVLIARVRNGQCAAPNEVSCQTTVGVRLVMCVPGELERSREEHWGL
jgi:hypothetical protein